MVVRCAERDFTFVSKSMYPFVNEITRLTYSIGSILLWAVTLGLEEVVLLQYSENYRIATPVWNRKRTKDIRSKEQQCAAIKMLPSTTTKIE